MMNIKNFVSIALLYVAMFTSHRNSGFRSLLSPHFLFYHIVRQVLHSAVWPNCICDDISSDDMTSFQAFEIVCFVLFYAAIRFRI